MENNQTKQFIVTLLGIVYNPKTKMIIIGKRENDPNIKKLSWCFPGGASSYTKDLEDNLIKEIKKKTNLLVKVKNVIFAKTYPENRKVLSIYFYCETSTYNAKAGDRFREVKWVKPLEVKKYFTTSLHKKVVDFLKTLK